MLSEPVFWQEMLPSPSGTVLTRNGQFKGYLSLLQKGLHTALEKLQSLAFARPGVQQHQHSARPWEQSPGATCFKKKERKMGLEKEAQ